MVPEMFVTIQTNFRSAVGDSFGFLSAKLSHFPNTCTNVQTDDLGICCLEMALEDILDLYDPLLQICNELLELFHYTVLWPIQ